MKKKKEEKMIDARVEEEKVVELKQKKPSFFKEKMLPVLKTAGAIVGGALVYVVAIIGSIFASLLPFIIMDKCSKKYYTDEEDGGSVQLKRWANKEEQIIFSDRKKHGEKAVDILTDLDLVKKVIVDSDRTEKVPEENSDQNELKEDSVEVTEF